MNKDDSLRSEEFFDTKTSSDMLELQHCIISKRKRLPVHARIVQVCSYLSEGLLATFEFAGIGLHLIVHSLMLLHGGVLGERVLASGTNNQRAQLKPTFYNEEG